MVVCKKNDDIKHIQFSRKKIENKLARGDNYPDAAGAPTALAGAATGAGGAAAGGAVGLAAAAGGGLGRAGGAVAIDLK